MEGSEVVRIPLDSLICTDSSDMLSPVDRPEFEHNRQDYQARLLQNSIRYEHNGWFAGWLAHMFTFEHDNPINTTPPVLSLVIDKTEYYFCPIYKLSDGDVEFEWCPLTKAVRQSGEQLTLTYNDDGTVHLSGITAINGDEWWIDVDKDTCSVIACSGNIDEDTVGLLFDDNRFSFDYTFYTKGTTFRDNLALMYAEPFAIGLDKFQYSLSGGVHEWGEYLEMDDEGFVAQPVDCADGFTYSVNDNEITLKYIIDLVTDYQVTYTTDEYPVDIQYMYSKIAKNYIGDTKDETDSEGNIVNIDVNEYGMSAVNIIPNYYMSTLNPTEEYVYDAAIEVNIPVWLSCIVSVSGSMRYDEYVVKPKPMDTFILVKMHDNVVFDSGSVSIRSMSSDTYSSQPGTISRVDDYLADLNMVVFKHVNNPRFTEYDISGLSFSKMSDSGVAPLETGLHAEVGRLTDFTYNSRDFWRNYYGAGESDGYVGDYIEPDSTGESHVAYVKDSNDEVVAEIILCNVLAVEFDSGDAATELKMAGDKLDAIDLMQRAAYRLVEPGVCLNTDNRLFYDYQYDAALDITNDAARSSSYASRLSSQVPPALYRPPEDLLQTYDSGQGNLGVLNVSFADYTNVSVYNWQRAVDFTYNCGVYISPYHFNPGGGLSFPDGFPEGYQVNSVFYPGSSLGGVRLTSKTDTAGRSGLAFKLSNMMDIKKRLACLTSSERNTHVAFFSENASGNVRYIDVRELRNKGGANITAESLLNNVSCSDFFKVSVDSNILRAMTTCIDGMPEVTVHMQDKINVSFKEAVNYTVSNWRIGTANIKDKAIHGLSDTWIPTEIGRGIKICTTTSTDGEISEEMSYNSVSNMRSREKLALGYMFSEPPEFNDGTPDCECDIACVADQLFDTNIPAIPFALYSRNKKATIANSASTMSGSSVSIDIYATSQLFEPVIHDNELVGNVSLDILFTTDNLGHKIAAFSNITPDITQYKYSPGLEFTNVELYEVKEQKIIDTTVISDAKTGTYAVMLYLCLKGSAVGYIKYKYDGARTDKLFMLDNMSKDMFEVGVAPDDIMPFTEVKKFYIDRDIPKNTVINNIPLFGHKLVDFKAGSFYQDSSGAYIQDVVIDSAQGTTNKDAVFFYAMSSRYAIPGHCQTGNLSGTAVSTNDCDPMLLSDDAAMNIHTYWRITKLPRLTSANVTTKQQWQHGLMLPLKSTDVATVLVGTIDKAQLERTDIINGYVPDSNMFIKMEDPQYDIGLLYSNRNGDITLPNNTLPKIVNNDIIVNDGSYYSDETVVALTNLNYNALYFDVLASAKYHVDATARFGKLVNGLNASVHDIADYKLVSVANSVYQFVYMFDNNEQRGLANFEVDAAAGSVSADRFETMVDVAYDDIIRFSIDGADFDEGTFTMHGVYNSKDVKYKGYKKESLFDVKHVEYNADKVGTPGYIDNGDGTMSRMVKIGDTEILTVLYNGQELDICLDDVYDYQNKMLFKIKDIRVPMEVD